MLNRRRMQVPVLKPVARRRSPFVRSGVARVEGLGFGDAEVVNRLDSLANGASSFFFVSTRLGPWILDQISYVQSVAVASFGAQLELRVGPDSSSATTSWNAGDRIFEFIYPATIATIDLGQLIQVQGKRLVGRLQNTNGVAALFITAIVFRDVLAGQTFTNPLGGGFVH